MYANTMSPNFSGSGPGESPRLRGGGQSAEAVVAFEEHTNKKVLRAKGRRTKEKNSMRTRPEIPVPSEMAGRDNCGHPPEPANQGPSGEAVASTGKRTTRSDRLR